MTLPGPVDYQQVARPYGDGRALAAGVLAIWRTAVAPHVSSERGNRLGVLDLGAGTGVFARAWAEWYGADVVAVDPALPMLAEASRRGLLAGVRLVGGRAERLPVRDAAVDVAWVSTALHHIGDLDAGAAELRRVLRPDGRLLVRGLFSDFGTVEWLAFFSNPGKALERYPSIQVAIDSLSRNGFALVALEEVAEPSRSTADVAAWLRRMRSADTLLTSFTDQEFSAALAVAERPENRERPVAVRLAFVVLSVV
jgi:ubiquinone/menaquinone biosynthesis C-methylase UbiE